MVRFGGVRQTGMHPAVRFAMFFSVLATCAAQAAEITDERCYGPNAEFRMIVNKQILLNGILAEVHVCTKSHVFIGFVPPASWYYEAEADAMDGIQASTWYHVYVEQKSGGTWYSCTNYWIQTAP